MSLGNIDFAQVILQYFCLLFSLCFHEAAHAAMANRCGDPSARLMGRMSLNPLAHIDPMGTVILPLIMMTTGVKFLFGWAKPVPFNPRNLNDMRKDPVYIALAGPLSNLLLACVFAVVLRVLVMLAGTGGGNLPFTAQLFDVAFTMIGINLILMLFNLLPVPPLDGHHVAYYFLPESGQRVMEQIGPFGILIAIFAARPIITPIFIFMMKGVIGFVLWGTG